MKILAAVCLSLLAWLNTLAAPGNIVLLNGTSSAGKSSLAEVMVKESKTKYEVISFDEFRRSYEANHRLTRWGFKEYNGVMVSLYRHVKEQSEAGKNVIVDTVEFDRYYDKYCDILNCSNVIKAIVYCPPQDILKRIDRRNNSGIPFNRRPVLLAFQQFLEMYKPQSSPDELVVERTSTTVLRAALAEAGKKANSPAKYQALYKDYVNVFGIDQDQKIIILPKGKYDLVINTRANTKKENLRLPEDYVKNRGRVP